MSGRRRKHGCAASKSIGGRLRDKISVRGILLLATSVLLSTALTLTWVLLWQDGLRGAHGHRHLRHGQSSGDDHEPLLVLRKCGETPAEARALGCRFELHNFAWVPPECYDGQLGDEWDSQPWEFARQNSSSPEHRIPQEVAMRGDLLDAWVPWYQHMAHCSLIWKKYHRAVALGRPMDSWTHSYMHSEHCADMLVNWELVEWRHLFNSHLFLKFPTCGYEWRHQKELMAEILANKTTQRHGHGHGHEHAGHGNDATNWTGPTLSKART